MEGLPRTLQFYSEIEFWGVLGRPPGAPGRGANPLDFNFPSGLNAGLRCPPEPPRGPWARIQFQGKIEWKKGLYPWYISFSSNSSNSYKMSSNVSSTLSLLVAKVDAQTALINALQAEVSSLRAAPTKSAPAASGGKPVAEKKPRKKSDAPPTAWRLFADRVRGLLGSNGYSGADLGVRCVQFCSSLKDENSELASWADADILARRAAWSVPAVSKGEAKFGPGWVKNKAWRKTSPTGSVVSGDADADAELDGDAPAADATAAPAKKRKNPWEGLTPEQRAAKVAAMKAGKAAKKDAASSSDGDAAPTESAPVKTEAAPPSPKMVAEPSSNAAAASSSSTAEVAGPEGFKKVALNGKTYWVNLANGHAYIRNKDQSQGDWAGIFSKTPKPHIDDSVPEPSVDDAEDDGLVFDE